ncbi:MAG: hypothetical protein EBU97_03795, partial [Rhodobacteraceae bacterium]|nr:hypothetical protein [Paracoccaceae bacterium]
MKHHGATALALILLATQAQADVTPEDVWKSWQDQATAAGQTVTAASVARDGDALVIEGLSIAAKSAEAGFTVLVSDLRFVDQGDGTVLVEVPADIPFEVTTQGEKPVTIKLTLSQVDFQMVASGTPQAMSYASSASTATVALNSVDGEDAGDVKFEATLSDVSGSTDYSGEGPQPQVKTSYQIGGLDLAFSGADAPAKVAPGGTPSSGEVTLQLADLKGESEGNIFAMNEVEDLSKALASGLSSKGSFSYGAGVFNLNGTDASGQTTVAATLTGGQAEIGLDATALHYQTTTTGLAVKVTSPDLPFPELNLGFSELSFGIGMPTTPKAEPGPFGLLVRLVDLTVSDEVWAMVDPTGQMPHDPATLVL